MRPAALTAAASPAAAATSRTTRDAADSPGFPCTLQVNVLARNSAHAIANRLSKDAGITV